MPCLRSQPGKLGIQIGMWCLSPKQQPKIKRTHTHTQKQKGEKRESKQTPARLDCVGPAEVISAGFGLAWITQRTALSSLLAACILVGWTLLRCCSLGHHFGDPRLLAHPSGWFLLSEDDPHVEQFALKFKDPELAQEPDAQSRKARSALGARELCAEVQGSL